MGIRPAAMIGLLLVLVLAIVRLAGVSEGLHILLISFAVVCSVVAALALIIWISRRK